jgi:hypothetical protein
MAVRAVVGMLLALVLARPVHAQVVVAPQQNLQFGLLTPGVPVSVTPTDVTRRAALTITARGRFSLTFTLPAALVSAGGQAIPLQFGGTDGLVDIRHKQEWFDPRTGVNIHINPADLQADVYVGGTAVPTPGQPAGFYQATIIMMVVQTGT